jgi:hypothetical protein
VQQTVTDLRTTVLSAAQSFPVGWNLYPNCAPQSPDTRCAALLVRATAAQRQAYDAIGTCGRDAAAAAQPAPAAATGGQPSATQAPSPAATESNCAPGGLSHVRWVASADSSGLLRWAIGLVLTILMAGLGTPFWIQVVNGFLAARNYVRTGSGPPLSEKSGADTK